MGARIRTIHTSAKTATPSRFTTGSPLAGPWPSKGPDARVCSHFRKITAMYITSPTVISTTPLVSETQPASNPSIKPSIDLLPGNQIGDASCNEAVTWGGKFLNPWNSYKESTQPSVTPCPPPASPPAPSVTCYHGADPDACPEEYNPGWCYCNDEAALYPILSGEDPCGYTAMPTTTTTSPICTATE